MNNNNNNNNTNRTSKSTSKNKNNNNNNNNINNSFSSSSSISTNSLSESMKTDLIKSGKYYSYESQKLSNYIKSYYLKHNDYPKSSHKFYRYYKFGRLIGRGAFGKVNLGLNVLSGRIVAIKSFNKKKKF